MSQCCEVSDLLPPFAPVPFSLFHVISLLIAVPLYLTHSFSPLTVLCWVSLHGFLKS